MNKQPWEIHREYMRDQIAGGYFEVRRRGQGTACDWEEGEWTGNFDTAEEAQAYADKLNAKEQA